MSDIRISMRKLHEVLRMRFDNKLSLRQISRSARVSLGTVSNYVQAFQKTDLKWPLDEDMSETVLVQTLFPEAPLPSRKGRSDPDWRKTYQELKGKGMTLQLLWEEYCQIQTLGAYSYAQFCHRYNQWRGCQKRSMRQHHKAGEKLFVDYAGPTVPIVNPQTGEVAHNAQIFVAVMGASNYTFAEATLSQKSEDWLGSHVRAFEFLGGVPEIVVPDNLKARSRKPAVMTQISTPATNTWRTIIKWWSSRPGLTNPKINPRRSWECSWLSDGFWRNCATIRSLLWQS